MSGKALTFVEMDLDLYRVTRFEAVTDAQPVANWSAPWSSDTTMTGIVDASLPSGRGARIVRTVGSSAGTLWRWDVPTGLENGSALALMRATGTTPDMGIALRTAGSSGDEDGYMLIVDYEDEDIRIAKYLGGVFSILEFRAFETAAPGDLVWVKFDAVNVAGPAVLLRGKAWVGELGDEPLLHTISIEDDTDPIQSVGGAGIYMFNADNVVDVGVFRVRSILGNEVETIRHAMPANYLPLRDIPAIPDIASVSLNPSMISLGQNLGKRAKLNVSFRDHPGADLGELVDSGSYWGKFRARQIFRRGQPIRIIRGLLGQDLGDMETRHYVLESFSGPSRDGTFTIVAQDAIKLADNERAQAPAISNGFLQSPIDAVTTSATLSPAGIGDAEYPSSGIVAIGGAEIAGFTRSGDALTLSRGQFGTAAVAHDAEDRVQFCLLYSAQDAATIIQDLLVGHAGIDPSYIPFDDWASEVATFLPLLYTRLIAEPTGVNRLVADLVQQAGLAIWTDDIANLIRLQVLQGVPTTAFLYNERNTLAGSIQSQEQPSKRLTQVWTYYGVRNPLEPLDAPENYRSSFATIDTEGETFQGDSSVLKVFGTWLPAFARSAAQRVNDLHLGRFSMPPRRITFAVMRHSGVPSPEPGGGYRIAWQGNQDETGQVVSAPIQVTRVNPLADRIEAEAEEMLFKQFDPADLTNRKIIIDAPENSINLEVIHNGIFPVATSDDVTAGVSLEVIINPGVRIGSVSTSVPAIHVGDGWPAGFPITLTVLGRVQGAGGPGGNSGSSGANGFPGGTALFTRKDITIAMVGGAGIWSGGGGGAGGFTDAGGGGGGGAGIVPGAGGISTSGAGSPGQPGVDNAGGDGGAAGPFISATNGGAGGEPGTSGTSTVAGSGGPPGAAIDGVGFVTFNPAGDIRGPQI